MEQSKMNMFIAIHGKKFKDSDKIAIIEGLKNIPDDNFIMIQSLDYKTPVNWLLLYIFLYPIMGLIDRLLLGEIGLGLLKLFTGGALGIWSFIDIFTMLSRVKNQNFKKLQPLLIA